MEASAVLLKMLVTEKATEMQSHGNQYTFKVDPRANRVNVARAVEETFKVDVRRVNIMNVKPKAKRDRQRPGRLGRKPGMKKAIVTLKEGQAIDLT